VNEDPICGSGHFGLAPLLWAGKLNKHEMVAITKLYKIYCYFLKFKKTGYNR
jgi:hypothetical protein